MSEPVFFPPRCFAAVPPPYGQLEQAKVVILPVPYDSTASWRSGQREGPQAIIDASQHMELYDIELGRELHLVGIHTLPELQPQMDNPAAMVARVEAAVRELLQKGKQVVMLGGEHTVTLGAVQAHRERFAGLSVLHLDAHADMREEYLGTKFSHAAVMRRVLDLCPVVSVGIRSLSTEESLFIRQRGLKLCYAASWSEAALKEVVSALSRRVYVTIDLDVLDPSCMAAVGTPEPGGFSYQQVLALLREVSREREVVGFDAVELSPSEGPIACSYLAAKLVYKFIGYITEGLK